jgi:hypothetical protein
MNGQWIGTASGANGGFVAMNIEKKNSKVGNVMFEDFDGRNVNFYCSLKVERKGEKINGILYNFCYFIPRLDYCLVKSF